MKLYAFLITFFLLASAAFSAKEWQSFSHPFPVRSVIPYDEGILLATDGGIRYRTSYGDFIYHSDNGLETSAYRALAASAAGTFAASENGLIAKINSDGKSWRVLSRSYLGNNVKVRPDAMVIALNILAIVFEDRLAFFDINREASVMTINKIADHALSVEPIDKISIHGDSLFVLIGEQTYVRVMDWKNIQRDNQLSNPLSWKLVKSKIEEFNKDNLKNALHKHFSNKLHDIRQQDFPPLYDSTGASLVKWTCKVADGYFLVTEESIIHFDGNRFRDLSPNDQFPLDDTYEIGSLPIGGAIAVSTNGGISYGNNSHWSEPKYPLDGSGSGQSGNSSRIKSLSATPDGHVFFHIWGLGYMLYSDWSINLRYTHLRDHDLCIDNFFEDDGIRYLVTVASTPAPDGSGFLATAGTQKGKYGIIYFTNNGEVHCANQVGSTMTGGPMAARIDEDGSWIIYVGARDGTIAASEGGLDVFKFRAPAKNGGELSDGTLKTYNGLVNSLIDIVYDSTEKRLWGVSISELAYLGEEDTAMVKPTSTRGMPSAEFTALDMDIRGNLWIGTLNQGAYRLSRSGKSPDSLVAINFSSRQGMLSNDISDLSIDPVLGAAWFAHSKGVSRYYRNDLKNAQKNMTDSADAEVKAYPIPFRPKKQRIFTIANIAEDAMVSIFNRGGALIRSFRNDEILGGKAEWNGKDNEGRLVAPGVYYYVVKNSSKVKKGKFIIIH